MFKFILRLRIMPVAIFVAVLIVSVKIGDVADLLTGNSALEVAKVQAQQPPAPKGVQAQAQNQGKGGPAPLQPAQAPAPNQPAQAPQRSAGDVVPAAPADSSDPANDPTLFTQNEIDLLQS